MERDTKKIRFDDPDWIVKTKQNILKDIETKLNVIENIDEEIQYLEQLDSDLKNINPFDDDLEELSIDNMVKINNLLTKKISDAFVWGDFKVKKSILSKGYEQPFDVLNESLLCSAHYNDVDAVNLLINLPGVDVNVSTTSKVECFSSDFNTTPLAVAAEYLNVESAKVLLSHPNILVNKVDGEGYTPLMRAAAYNQIKPRTGYGKSMNHHEFQKRKREMLSLLLSQPNIDVGVQNDKGKTAYELCEEPECKSLILESNLNIKPGSQFLNIVMKSLRQQEICEEFFKLNQIISTLRPENVSDGTKTRLEELRLSISHLALDMNVPDDVKKDLEERGELCEFLSFLIGWKGTYEQRALKLFEKQKRLRQLLQLQQKYESSLKTLGIYKDDDVTKKSLKELEKEAHFSYYSGDK